MLILVLLTCVTALPSYFHTSEVCWTQPFITIVGGELGDRCPLEYVFGDEERNPFRDASNLHTNVFSWWTQPQGEGIHHFWRARPWAHFGRDGVALGALFMWWEVTHSETRSQAILFKYDITIIVNMNPTSRPWVEKGHYCLRENANGVDLNRNYDVKWKFVWINHITT